MVFAISHLLKARTARVDEKDPYRQLLVFLESLNKSFCKSRALLGLDAQINLMILTSKWMLLLRFKKGKSSAWP